MKGVSIPINTLVMLAVAIIVLLAAVAWFMGAFGPTAQEQTHKQKFDALCMQWSTSNCAEGAFGDEDTDGTPDRLCEAYNGMNNRAADTACSDWESVAAACGCIPPYGSGRP